ncbi:hypothetical protein F4779DRAFT_609358 [Xylariaceae sp. FL0662B]|nr:hypothetical protein F4779DRAFT_609358 [Xylariaceae sp. FL0662B]
MENVSPSQVQAQNGSPESITPGRKRSGSGGSILSKFPFLRTADSKSNLDEAEHADSPRHASNPPPRALAAISQQQKTRKRKGSLRKVALLGRGAARERRELKPLAIDTSHTAQLAGEPASAPILGTDMANGGLGLGISDVTPRPSMDGHARRDSMPAAPPPAADAESQVTSPTISYTSTTDEEAAPPLPVHTLSPPRPELSSGSESYYPNRAPSNSIQRRRSVKHSKSPLSLQGLTASPLPTTDEPHDYSETAWWGWVMLIVTWFVFIIGMGSCMNVWSWAWDVGTTPYAPPEFEDDPTLPIVGYYPALIILTCIMAWVWVFAAWMGMKYFRHAKINND